MFRDWSQFSYQIIFPELVAEIVVTTVQINLRGIDADLVWPIRVSNKSVPCRIEVFWYKFVAIYLKKNSYKWTQNSEFYLDAPNSRQHTREVSSDIRISGQHRWCKLTGSLRCKSLQKQISVTRRVEIVRPNQLQCFRQSIWKVCTLAAFSTRKLSWDRPDQGLCKYRDFCYTKLLCIHPSKLRPLSSGFLNCNLLHSFDFCTRF